MYRVDQSKQAKNDEMTARRAGHGAKFAEIMNVVKRDPFESTPGHYFERLGGNLKGICSRRINYSNRFIYGVFPNTENATDENGELYDGIVRVYVSWGHDYSSVK